MHKALAVIALVFGILGTLAGVNEWFLNRYILPMVNWDGPLQTLADLSWFFETVLLGLAVICLSVALLFRQTRPPTPAIVPPSLPGQSSLPPPVHEQAPSGRIDDEGEDPPSMEGRTSPLPEIQRDSRK